MDPPCPSIQPGPAENEMQTSMVMGFVFPKPVVRSRFSAGLNLHKALEENPCPSTAALKKRALEPTGEAQRFSRTSSLGLISFDVNFHLSTSRGAAFAGMPGPWAIQQAAT